MQAPSLRQLAADASEPAQTVPELRSRQQAFERLECACKQAAAEEVSSCLQTCSRLLLQICSDPQGPTESLAHASYYAALLKALHALILEARQKHGLHVTSFVQCLRRFWTYGIGNSSELEGHLAWRGVNGRDQAQARDGPTPRSYQPPQRRTQRSGTGTDAGASDSEASDSEGGLGTGDRLRSSKARLAALLCLQALAKSDPKALHRLWLGLLPVYSALARRRGDESLLDLVLKDPSPKVRVAAATAVAALLEGPQQRAYFAMAEQRDSDRRPVRGFTTLSASLGELAMSTHEGLLTAAQEQSSAVLTATLRALAALIAAAPYSRLPQQLLPDVISTLWKLLRQISAANNGAATSRASSHSQQAAVLSCLAAAFSSKPRHPGLALQLTQPGRDGSPGAELVLELVQKSQTGPSAVSLESLAVLRSLAATYPEALESHCGRLVALAAGMGQRASGGNAQKEQDDLAALQAARVIASLLASSPSQPDACQPLETDANDLAAGSSLERSFAFESSPVSDSASNPGHSGEPRQQASWLTDDLLLRICRELFLQMSQHASPAVRAGAYSIPAAMPQHAFLRCPADVQSSLLCQVASAATSDAVAHVRAAAGKAAAQLATFAQLAGANCMLPKAIRHLLADSAVSVRIQGGAALANLAATFRTAWGGNTRPTPSGLDDILPQLTEAALGAAADTEKVSVSALRALGSLLALRFSLQCQPGETELQRAVQCYMQALRSGSSKSHWNVCYGVGGLLKLPAAAAALEASSQLPELLLAISSIASTSPNFKSRKHAASVLAAVGSRQQCGDNFARIHANLRAAADEAENPAFSQQAESAPSPPLDFRSLPEMREQLSAALSLFSKLTF